MIILCSDGHQHVTFGLHLSEKNSKFGSTSLRYLYSSLYGLLIGLPIALLIVGAILLGYFSDQGDGPADAFAVPSSDISYYEDSNNALDVERIRELETSYEKIQSGTTPNFGFSKSTKLL